MSKKNRKIFLALTASVLAVFLLVIVGIAGFIAGRNTQDLSNRVENPLPISTGEVIEELSTVEVQVDKKDNNLVDSSKPTVVHPTTPEPTIPAKEEVSAPAELEISALQQEESEPFNLELEDLQLFIEVWEIVSREFDGQLPTGDEVTFEAIQRSLDLLDDEYTRFIVPEEAQLAREHLQGSYDGIGAIVDLSSEGYLLIVKTFEGSPAKLAGLQSGDLITHLDGESVVGLSLSEIITLVKGPRGTEVLLMVQRDDKLAPEEIKVVRQRIHRPLVEAEMLENNIAYAHLTSFSNGADQQLKDAISTLLQQEPEGLILDLRFNPGGFLDQSVAVADLFLPEGIVLYEHRSNGVEDEFRSATGDLAEEIKLAVLINSHSASASEIVAGAIKDRRRGMLIGETTFGKGSVQQTHRLSNDAQLRVTIAKWFTPNNNTIQEIGIRPDIEVLTSDNLIGDRDLQLERAVDYILSGE